MDSFFVQILLLDEIALSGLGILAAIVGGVLAGIFMNVQISLRRVSYLWFIALLTLFVIITQFIWVLTPAAADAGMLSVLIITGFGMIGLFGVGMYYASAARSRHICGETSNAWMGFIPFVNLWLIFKGGRSEVSTPSGAPRSAIARYVQDPALVIGALMVFGLSQALSKAMEETTLYSTSDSAALVELITQSRSIEETFAEEARYSAAQLPVRIDEITIISDVVAQGRTLRITYDVDLEDITFRPEFADQVAAHQCAPDVFGPAIALGGVVEIVYRRSDTSIIETYTITQRDCDY